MAMENCRNYHDDIESKNPFFEFGIDDIFMTPFLLPKKYIDARHDQIIDDFSKLPIPLLNQDNKVIIKGRLDSYDVRRNSVPSRTIARVIDRCGNVITATFFGDPRIWVNSINEYVNKTIYFFGDISFYKNYPQLNKPEIIDLNVIGTVIPVYPGKTRGIKSEDVFDLLHYHHYLVDNIDIASEWLNDQIYENSTVFKYCNWLGDEPDLKKILKSIHWPKTPNEGIRSIAFLKHIAALCTLTKSQHEVIRPCAKESSIAISRKTIRELLQEISLNPTDEQESVIFEICNDLIGQKPMMRLLSADVGFGKTLVAATVCAAVVRSGKSVVWLCPNQPLAVQTEEEIKKWWPDINPCLMVGGHKKTRNNNSRFIIGTTAVHFQMPDGYFPELLVIDESQRFGEDQKNNFIGSYTNVLNVTATCIPRTAALVEWGGMDVSKLEKAHVEKNIITTLVHAKDRMTLFNSVKKSIEAGHQALIIYPLAETSKEKLKDKKSAEGAFKIWEKHFPNRVRFIHGRLKNQEKIKAIKDMRDDLADLLISTTAVETGINLPRLRHVVIVHPERLGVNSLHQIRGRCCRTGGDGKCDLFLPDEIKEASIQRLSILVNFTNGFDVANENMKLQGFGDLGTDGKSQSGRSKSFIPNHKIEYKEIHWVEKNWFKPNKY